MRLSSSAHSARFARQLFWKRKRRKWISGLTRRTQSRISHNKQEAALKKDIPYALLYATKKSLFLFWQEEIEIERVRERERRERMIGNEMKTNKVHNIMIIVAYIFSQKFFTAFWGKWVERDAQHTIYVRRVDIVILHNNWLRIARRGSNSSWRRRYTYFFFFFCYSLHLKMEVIGAGSGVSSEIESVPSICFIYVCLYL